jgi:[ribosomal protein S18]-alanine N-acetyltransferase
MTTIRPFSMSDKDEVIALLKSNIPLFFAEEEQQDFVSYISNEIEMYFVMEDEQKIIGAGGINFQENKTIAIISWDFFGLENQGKGYGSALLTYRLNLITEIETVKKVIVRTSQLVFPFYEKHGFKLKSITKDFWSKGFDMYLMEKA